jgi:hypothetical protein
MRSLPRIDHFEAHNIRWRDRVADIRKISETTEKTPDLDRLSLDRRENEAKRLVTHMIILNCCLTVFLAIFAGIELYGVWNSQIDTAERLIDSKVMIAYITGITIQVGTIALTGSKWFFRG